METTTSKEVRTMVASTLSNLRPLPAHAHTATASVRADHSGIYQLKLEQANEVMKELKSRMEIDANSTHKYGRSRQSFAFARFFDVANLDHQHFHPCLRRSMTRTINCKGKHHYQGMWPSRSSSPWITVDRSLILTESSCWIQHWRKYRPTAFGLSWKRAAWNRRSGSIQNAENCQQYRSLQGYIEQNVSFACFKKTR